MKKVQWDAYFTHFVLIPLIPALNPPKILQKSLAATTDPKPAQKPATNPESKPKLCGLSIPEPKSTELSILELKHAAVFIPEPELAAVPVPELPWEKLLIHLFFTEPDPTLVPTLKSFLLHLLLCSPWLLLGLMLSWLSQVLRVHWHNHGLRANLINCG